MHGPFLTKMLVSMAFAIWFMLSILRECIAAVWWQPPSSCTARAMASSTFATRTTGSTGIISSVTANGWLAGVSTNSRRVCAGTCRPIAAAIGLQVPAQTRLLFVETPASHPFAVTELMMPVLPVVRVANVEEAIALAVQLEGGCHHTAAMHSRNIDNMNQMANAIDTSIFVKNGPCIAGLGLGGEGWTTMTITTPTGEGVTSARTFVRLRRCVLVDAFRIV